MVNAQKMLTIMPSLEGLEKPTPQKYLYIKSTCQEHLNKVLQFLGMLVKDPYQQELLKIVQRWTPGDMPELTLFTQTPPTSSIGSNATGSGD